MALLNQQGMYNGSTRLNPLPYVNIALQQRARKQAREEAIDKYYRDLPGRINDKGVRYDDREYLESLRNDIFDKGFRYRDALRKGDGAAKLEVEQSMRKFAAAAAQSQNLGKRALERGKMYLNKDNRWVIDDEEFIKAEAAEALPINNPEHKEMDMLGILSNRPFDEKEYGKEVSGKIKYGTKPIREADPNDPNYEIVSIVPDLDKKTTEELYAYAAEKVNGNQRFRKYLEKKTPEQLSQLNEVSKKVFGHYIREDFAEEDIAAAYTALQLPVTSTKAKVQANYTNREKEKRNYAEGEFDRRQRIRTRDSLIKIAANKPGGSGVETSGNSYDEIGGVEDLVNDKITISQGMVTDNKTNMPYTGTTPFKREYLPANVTTALAAGKISIPREVTVVVKDGKIEAIRTSTGEISRQAIENLQKKVNTEPVKGAQPVYGNPKTKQVEQKPKTGYSRADLKSGGWTDEQIDKAVKAGKIKLN